MGRLVAVALLSGICLAAPVGAEHARGASAHARELAACFNKDKHKVRDKRGEHLEVFVEVRGEPAARRNAAEYSGSYESDPNYALDLRVAADGSAEGRGTEPAPGGPRRFTLRDARVSGATLTGTKVYEDDATERLEAVFLDLTVRHSPTGAGTTQFGLGVVFDPPKAAGGGLEMNRLFYALERQGR